MKNVKYAVLLLLLFFVGSTIQAQGNKNLSIFLGKLKSYVERHDILLSEPNMPMYKPDSLRPQMPSPDITGYMEDRETGLRLYGRYGKVVDPETGYSFHIQSGKISLEDAVALRDKFKLRQ